MRFKELQTAEVVVVEAVDYNTWTCAVRPKARVDVRGNVQDMPIIMNVPIALQKAGNTSVMLPIKVGDVGVAIFSKHALDNLLIEKTTTTITIPRNFDINDAIYISGLYTGVETVPNVAEGEMLLHHESGSHIKFFANGNIEIKGNRVDINEL